MPEMKRRTMWLTASFVCSILGCLGAVGWLASTARPPVETTGVSSGLALLYVGLPSFTLCSLGIIFGVVAVGWVLRDEFRGAGLARTGIIIGWLPFAVYFVGSLFGLWRMPW
jgi:hypothetical protein